MRDEKSEKGEGRVIEKKHKTMKRGLTRGDGGNGNNNNRVYITSADAAAMIPLMVRYTSSFSLHACMYTVARANASLHKIVKSSGAEIAANRAELI